MIDFVGPDFCRYYGSTRPVNGLAPLLVRKSAQAAQSPRFRVVQRNGWSYVEGDPTPRDSGPWRYDWEAQEYADDLNEGRTQP